MRTLSRARWASVLLALALAGPAWAAVQVSTRLERRAVTLGESVNFEVIVSGAMGGVSEPDLGLPTGVEVLASARGQNFSFLNGSSSSSVSFRYELAPGAAGHYRIGPVRVRVGSQVYEAEAVDLEVTAAPRQVGGHTGGAASLVAEVNPPSPYVGQMTLLRVRLIQGSSLAEDPQYSPPSTTGFWSERTSDPESYYAQQGGKRVMVTETRTRLYPLAPGAATISEAAASLVLAEEDSPFPLFGGSRRSVVVRSEPLRVKIRPLPAGAPEGFTGGVGRIEAQWATDRASTARDVPLTVRLDVRGVGNLPLLKTPPLDLPDWEMFGSSMEDSLPAPGSVGNGRRRFQWTLLPRRTGRLALPAPAFSWFDPEAAVYRKLSVPALAVDVGPPSSAGSTGSEEAFPSVFLRHPADPESTPGSPWPLAIAGAMLGIAWMLWRGSSPGAEAVASVAQQREWLRAIGLARGPDFWDAADRAARWLEARGRPVGSLPREIAAARFGGLSADEERFRRRLVELLSSTLEGGAPAATPRWIAAGLGVAAIAVAVVLGPHGGGAPARLRSLRADQQARIGEADAARAEWLSLWKLGQSPSLAARLAWTEIRRGRVGEAAAWVVRGDEGEPRDPGLDAIAERVSEAGGLTGERTRRIPLRAMEWGILAGLSAALGFSLLNRRMAAILLLAAAVVLALAPTLERVIDGGGERGAVLRSAHLEGTAVELEPGQVVRIRAREHDRVRVRVGELEGWLDGIAVAGTGSGR